MPTRELALVALVALGAAARADQVSYDGYRQPAKVMAALALKPGQRVADVGAGRGYFTFRLADAVGPKGRVVATEIDDAALSFLYARAAGMANVVVRKVGAADPGLEAGGYDVILLAQVDHYLRDRADFFGRLRAALAPGGRLAVQNRMVFREAVLAAAERAGLEVAGETADLPGQFLLLFVARERKGDTR